MCPRRRPSAAVAAALIAALVLGACGQSEIDVDKAARFIERAVSKQVGAQVKSVTCPDTVKVKAKGRFTCVVTGSDGTKGNAELTQKDDKGNLTFYAPFLHTSEAEQVMQTQIANSSRASRGSTVDCPEIVVVAKGRTFDCVLRKGGAERTIAARQTTAQGNFTYRVTG